jgi:outer membrane immunogenic protein
MLRALTSASAIAVAALIAQPAMAQDSGRTFEGPYVSGTVSLDSIDSGAKGLVFDADRDGQFDDDVRNVAGANAFSPGFCNGAAVGNSVNGGCSSDDQEIGYSARLGYDARFGNSLVVGVLVEGSKSNAVNYAAGFSTTPASYTVASEVDYAISGRARIGFAPGNGGGLFYVTGGPSYAKIDNTFATTNTANSFTVNDDDDMEWGYQVGGGAEVMLGTSLSLGLEYLYSNYDNGDAFVAVGPGTAPATNPFLLRGGGTNLRAADRSLDSHSFRVTAGFHF